MPGREARHFSCLQQSSRVNPMRNRQRLEARLPWEGSCQSNNNSDGRNLTMRGLSSAVLKGVMAVAVMTFTLCAAATISQAQDKVRIAFLVKNLGNRFFDAVRDGGLEA